MASVRHYYAVETKAHRDGYTVSDVDGHTGYEDGEALWKQEGLPPALQPGPCGISSEKPAEPDSLKARVHPKPSVPDTEFLKTWLSYLPVNTDVRLSDDAGRYLCEFIYYTSLAHAFREGRQGSIVFLHVPGWVDQANIEKGRDIVIALVKTLVSSWFDRTSN